MQTCALLDGFGGAPYDRWVSAEHAPLVVEDNGVGSALPQLLSSLDSLRAEAAYRWSDKLDLTFDLRYESFSSDDWALADVAPDTLPTVLTLGATPYDYDVWALGIGFRYYLGGRGLQLVN